MYYRNCCEDAEKTLCVYSPGSSTVLREMTS